MDALPVPARKGHVIMEFFVSLKRQTFAVAICYILIGLFFAIRPGTALITIGRVVAVATLIIGIVKIVGYFSSKNYDGPFRNSLAIGTIISIASVFFLINTDLMVSLLYAFIGFALLVDGVIQFQSAIDLRRFKSDRWLVVLILSLVTIALSVVVLINPFSTAKTLMLISGIFLMISGASDLVSLIFINKMAKEIKTDKSGNTTK